MTARHPTRVIALSLAGAAILAIASTGPTQESPVEPAAIEDGGMPATKQAAQPLPKLPALATLSQPPSIIASASRDAAPVWPQAAPWPDREPRAPQPAIAASSTSAAAAEASASLSSDDLKDPQPVWQSVKIEVAPAPPQATRAPLGPPPWPGAQLEPAPLPDMLAFVAMPRLPTAAPKTLLPPPLTGAKPAPAPGRLIVPTQYEILLGRALDAHRAGRPREALDIVSALPVTSPEKRVVNWITAVDYGDLGQDLNAISDWPAMHNVRLHAERVLLRPEMDPARIVSMFANHRPETQQGARALARAETALGHDDKARDALSALWRTEKLDSAVEAAIIKEFGALLTTSDHRARMERMFHADRVQSAMRVADLAKSPALAAAWSAVIRGDKKAAQLLEAVPYVERGAGHAFAKARLLRRAGKYQDAAAAMLAAPTDAAAYADPDAWWTERRVLSRELLDLNDAATAYRVAAAHVAETPEIAADAEFHAGWYALRFLNDPAKAAPHFARISQISRGATSLARGYYWQARAAQAGGPGDARNLLEHAAAYPTAFYGQLAASQLDYVNIEVATPQPSEQDRRRFAALPMVDAIRTLERIGETKYADRLYRTLARQLVSPGELSLLVAQAKQRDITLALRTAKAAANRGLPIGGLAHPTGAIPAQADISGAGKALAYAIARQESEFNASAVSRAGARGLLQLLPGTARDMARKTGLAFAPERLTTDVAYNATLGSAFLSDQLGRFSGSYVMTFAGYNAGPKRARDWANRYGDPRGKSVEDVVDWIERIPFTETRNYVQRVMENYQVYKMRLTGRFSIASDLVQGREGT
jgi:soluble lytic murein transglycosylase